jgi:HSP20 family protein
MTPQRTPPIAPPAVWVPHVELLEQNHWLVVRVDLTGLTRDDFEIEIIGRDLVIRGDRKLPELQARPSVARRMATRFYRRVPLPYPVEPEEMEATFRDGVLEIRTPKPADVTAGIAPAITV